MKKITDFIYVTRDKETPFVSIGTNFAPTKMEEEIIKELDDKVRKLIGRYENKLNKEL